MDFVSALDGTSYAAEEAESPKDEILPEKRQPPPGTDEDHERAALDVPFLLVDQLLELENRVRALEGVAPLTRAEYRAKLVARWKELSS